MSNGTHADTTAFDPVCDDHALASAGLLEAAPHAHVVQFYDEDEFLVGVVTRFFAAGLASGDHLVMIATPPHRGAVARALDALGAGDLVASGRLARYDARDTLAEFMVDGSPDPELFAGVVAAVMSRARASSGPNARVRAYGEMVDLLWRAGDSTSALRLEELWNDAAAVHDFALLCAYAMGNFHREGDQTKFLAVCRQHAQVLPTEAIAVLEDPDARLREVTSLQQRARALESEVQHRRELEAALRDALRERCRAEEELRACVKREREARARAESSEAFKEVFLGMLGHDLRNPLNTVLTTARLMTIRCELPADSQQRLERIVQSGVRMQRMVDQLLDFARARLAGGIAVKPRRQDVVPLVSRIVDEVRAAHPSHAIELEGETASEGNVDPDRFEQVVSNLLGNAVTHGDPERPVRVRIGTNGRITVRNQGPPIPDGFLTQLFDPFSRARKPEGRSDGLGLGLYISERIVRAHGGAIEVTSSLEAGTCFDVCFDHGD